MKTYTTLEALKERAPKYTEYLEKLLRSLNKEEVDAETIPMDYVFMVLGFRGAVWALCSVPEIDDKIRQFVSECADSIAVLYENLKSEYESKRENLETIEDIRFSDKLNNVSWAGSVWAEAKRQLEVENPRPRWGMPEGLAVGHTMYAASAASFDYSKQKQIFRKYFC